MSSRQILEKRARELGWSDEKISRSRLCDLKQVLVETPKSPDVGQLTISEPVVEPIVESGLEYNLNSDDSALQIRKCVDAIRALNLSRSSQRDTALKSGVFTPTERSIINSLESGEGRHHVGKLRRLANDISIVIEEKSKHITILRSHFANSNENVYRIGILESNLLELQQQYRNVTDLLGEFEKIS